MNNDESSDVDLIFIVQTSGVPRYFVISLRQIGDITAVIIPCSMNCAGKPHCTEPFPFEIVKPRLADTKLIRLLETLT